MQRSEFFKIEVLAISGFLAVYTLSPSFTFFTILYVDTFSYCVLSLSLRLYPFLSNLLVGFLAKRSNFSLFSTVLRFVSEVL